VRPHPPRGRLERLQEYQHFAAQLQPVVVLAEIPAEMVTLGANTCSTIQCISRTLAYASDPRTAGTMRLPWRIVITGAVLALAVAVMARYESLECHTNFQGCGSPSESDRDRRPGRLSMRVLRSRSVDGPRVVPTSAYRGFSGDGKRNAARASTLVGGRVDGKSDPAGAPSIATCATRNLRAF
jgi:hypothetical protein